MSFDEMTIDRLAKIICDIGGPYERKGYQLERLLRRAKWPDPPQYDGSARVSWLRDILTEHQDDTDALHRLVCRICDPLEYDDGLDTARVICEVVNRILEPEGLVVTYSNGRPIISTRAEQEQAEGKKEKHLAYGVPSDLRSRLSALISDRSLVDLLVSRAEEASICQRNEAYTMAIIAIGSFMEGLLYGVIVERYPRILKDGIQKSNGASVQADRVDLYTLIDYAHKRKWIQTDAKDFMHKVRDYRNFVHPRHQLQNGFIPDRDTVALCWAPVHALLNDLEATKTVR